jgi:hypothetical protein
MKIQHMLLRMLATYVPLQRVKFACVEGDIKKYKGIQIMFHKMKI